MEVNELEIKVEVTAGVWQRFSMLCVGKDAAEVLAEMVNTAWEKAPVALKRQIGETVVEEAKATTEETPTAPQPTATEEMPIVESAVEAVTATPEPAVEQPATEETKFEKKAEEEVTAATDETPIATQQPTATEETPIA
jgi:fused signal recognition particle receptor